MSVGVSLRSKKRITVKCVICDYNTTDKDHLKEHNEAVHEGKKPYKCVICDYNTSDKDHLNRHIEAVHEGKLQFNCYKCEFSSIYKVGLQKHILCVHEENNPLKTLDSNLSLPVQQPIESADEPPYKTCKLVNQPQLPSTPLPLITATFSLNTQLKNKSCQQ